MGKMPSFKLKTVLDLSPNQSDKGLYNSQKNEINLAIVVQDCMLYENRLEVFVSCLLCAVAKHFSSRQVSLPPATPFTAQANGCPAV